MLASTSLRRLAALPVALVFAAATVVAAPQTASAAGGGHKAPPPKIQKAMKAAKAQIGKPYVYGADGPGSFDCSGFTSYAYAKAGIKLPRTSGAQAARARNISRKNMRRGDLVFFHSGGDVYHLGIYWGRRNGQRVILDSPRPGESVGFTRIWTNAWFPGRVGPKGSSAPKLKSFDKRDHRKSGKNLGAMSR